MCSNGIQDVGEDGVDCGGACACCLVDAAAPPCRDGLLTDSTADASATIDCTLDLAGASVQLSTVTSVLFGGGSIINGTLNTTSPTVISASLLRRGLNLVGPFSLPGGQTALRLCPENWGLVQGSVTLEQAQSNRDGMSAAFAAPASVGALRLDVDDLDVTCDVASPGSQKRLLFQHSIMIYDAFHLAMTDDVHIRVFPNDKNAYDLILVFQTDGTIITGGNLHGDRYEHDYVNGDDGPNDLGYGIEAVGTHNFLIEGVTVNNMTGDAFIVTHLRWRWPNGTENYTPYGATGIIPTYARNVTVRNNVFDENRRNGFALTDVIDAVLEGNVVRLSGQGGEYNPTNDGYNWRGVIPRAGLDLEPITYLDDDGNMGSEALVQHVVIRNNTFVNNYRDIVFLKAQYVEVYDNRFGSSLGNLASAHVSIHDNTMVCNTGEYALTTSYGISANAFVRETGDFAGTHVAHNWTVHDNYLSGFDMPLRVSAKDTVVYNNVVEDFETALMFSNGLNYVIRNNSFSSARDNARGVYSFVLGTAVDNVTIDELHVNVTGAAAYGLFLPKHQAGPAGTRIVNSTFHQRLRLEHTTNVTVESCTFPSIIMDVNNTNLVLTDNTITEE